MSQCALCRGELTCAKVDATSDNLSTPCWCANLPILNTHQLQKLAEVTALTSSSVSYDQNQAHQENRQDKQASASCLCPTCLQAFIQTYSS